nr:hypothetical protein 13 [bacterium]
MDMTTVIKNYHGEPIKEDNGEDLTLGTIITDAMSRIREQDSGKSKYKKYRIGLKALEKKADFTTEEIEIIKGAVGETYSPIIVGPVYELLDPNLKKE